ncbi:hypothetical protein [Nonomuraea diastatica]|uniref:hypothetical protein n=1 Tax=Nonomuraea diastatica TaxID=1848329 RepID=UPI001408BBB9|nr:hypothetical protein [Nonomuraea diastatica]
MLVVDQWCEGVEFGGEGAETATLPPVRFADLRELAADARQSPELKRAAEYARGAKDLG